MWGESAMYENIKNKKLLILGATPGEISLVKRAQEFGVKVYVTDYHTDYSLSPAKKYADVAWDISWSDLDTLESMCRKEGIDGITAGYSEIRVENVIKLFGRLGLPCYTTMNQLEITRDKIKFKEECRLNGVPIVKEYKTIEDVDTYPVIVKPVDRAGSIGISVAHDKEELKKAYDYAMDMSLCKKVIIEEYIYKAVKFDVYYEIVDGEIELISTDDVINATENGTKKVVQSGWMLPSIHQNAFKKKIDPCMRRMIEHMGIKNGYIFFSGFADKNSNFVFFECGFRLCGGHLYNYFPFMGFHNNLDIFILHALTGSAKEAVKGECVNPNLKCVTINLYAKSGIVKKISGWEKIQQMKDCRFALQYAHIGQKCADDKAILSKLGMVYFCSDSIEQLKKDVAEMYTYFVAEDEEGKDMVYDRVNPDYISEWWKGDILNGL